MQVGDRVRTDLVDGQEELEVADVDPGVQLRAEPGSRVVAMRPGAVEAAQATSTGLEVVVQGDDGNTYFYGCVEPMHVHVSQRVTPGRTIAEVGRGGVVHFDVQDGTGIEVDPAGFLTLPPAEAAGEPASVDEASSEPKTISPGEVVHLEPGDLRPSETDMAEALRAAGWTVEPPAPPAPILGGGNPGL